MGWFLDVYLTYFFKMLVRTWQTMRSRTWPVFTAMVGSSEAYGSGGLGCPKTEIVYVYTVEGSAHGGMYEKPFLFKASAETYASRFTPGNSLIVRLKPQNKTVSLVRDGDQNTSPAKSSETPKRDI